VRIACLKSLRIGSVQFASNSTHIKIASIAAAGASQSKDRNDKQKTGFFDSIGHPETNDDISDTSGLHPTLEQSAQSRQRSHAP